MKKMEIGDNLCGTIIAIAFLAVLVFAICMFSGCVPGTCSTQIDLDEALPHYLVK